VLTALALGGCTAQADIANLRAEQRLLARRLADTRADVQAVKGDLARLRGELDDLGYRRRYAPPPPPPPAGYDRYDQQPSTGLPDDPAYAPSEPAGRSPDTTNPSPGDSRYGATEPYPPSGTQEPSSYPPSGSEEPAPSTGEPVASTSTDLQNDYTLGSDGDYRQGLESYQRGDYARAVQSLRRFVGRNPTSDTVPTAQFWIGESYYSQGKFNEAILAYNEILVAWPKSERVPAALLRQANAFANLGDKIDARLILQKLISDHPGSQEAEQAKTQLRALGA
jgi:tol-pal system protein YbgF